MAQTPLDDLNLFSCKVIERDSRVTVIAKDNKRELRVHLRNTGRLNNLIYRGATVLCERKENGKTDATVIGVLHDSFPVLLDTYVQEVCFEKAIERELIGCFPLPDNVKRGFNYEGKSFDFEIQSKNEKEILEIKSAVTCKNGWASYPDAPSKRGLEHVNLLSKLSSIGKSVYICFVVTDPRCKKFRPNKKIQPEMAKALSKAKVKGVKIFAVQMILTVQGSVILKNDSLPVELEV